MKKFFYRFSRKRRRIPTLSHQEPKLKIPKIAPLSLALENSTGPWHPLPRRQSPARLPVLQTNAPADYASDLVVVHDAQAQALEQARQMLAQGENLRDRSALETAIKEMERAQAALGEAEKIPGKIARRARRRTGRLSGAAESHPARISHDAVKERQPERQPEPVPTAADGSARNAARRKPLRNRTSGGGSAKRATARAVANGGSPERTGAAAAGFERAFARAANRVASRARTDQEREDIQRQLKRLRDEERQMLANVDELRQQLAQSPNASSQAETRQQLDQTRSDMERAAQEMERDSASQALAAGTRAQQTMQNLRDDLRKQTSSQFAEQMRQLRNQARD